MTARRSRSAGGYAELAATWRTVRESAAPCGSCNGTGYDIPSACTCRTSAAFNGVHSCPPVPCQDCGGSGVIV